ncbi:MAG TPA: dihydrolipoamide acetyltransferase family protein [Gaiellaceae bacterium]|nr:dihydrolipoamide acetyltransferase family protein [Gaiellaceae bacterium]
MANQVTLPRLGQGMESGTIVRWLKAEGERVEKGEPLYELDTEKVTQEVEADAAGVLLRILAGEGEEIEVGKAIAVIGEEGEAVAEPEREPERREEGEEETPGRVEPDEGGSEVGVEKPAEGPEREDERERGREAATEEAEEETTPAGGAATTDGGRVKASPLARRIARERGIELAGVRGTGPEGRIVAEDVERAEKAPAPAAAPAGAPAPPPGEVEAIPLTGIRKTIARRMTEAWEAPAFQITMTADMTAAVRLREALVARTEEGEAKPTYSDVLTKVCAVALMRHRAVNALFAGDEIQLQPTANVGIAVAVPNGLLVPVLRSCETKTVPQLARERADLVARTREGKLRQEDLEGGTFTISNLGMYGVERFVAVLNPPQAAILAVGAIEERAVVRDGEAVARPAMEMTLTCDHRSVDGATASEFLRTVKQLLEEPGLAL